MSIQGRARLMGAIGAAVALGALSIGTGKDAVAQTVNDYEVALAKVVTTADASKASMVGGEAACVPLVNYTFVSMAPEELVGPLSFGGLASWERDEPTAATRAQRDACLASSRQPVITFDGGLGEDIVSQPPLEDPNKPMNTPVQY